MIQFIIFSSNWNDTEKLSKDTSQVWINKIFIFKVLILKSHFCNKQYNSTCYLFVAKENFIYFHADNFLNKTQYYVILQLSPIFVV